MRSSGRFEQFDSQRKEWTERKHRILTHYITVALAKLSRISKQILLVDGFAGANQYSETVQGSTLIMANAAANVKNAEVTVAACEADAQTFSDLNKNLIDHIAAGRVVTFFGRHADHVEELLGMAGTGAAVVFLDPPGSLDSFSISEDLDPWCRRQGPTDVLGLFFPLQVMRAIAGQDFPNKEERLQAVLGDCNLKEATVDQVAEAFSEGIERKKKFYGSYAVFKKEPKALAYVIYGLSDSAHGFALLSDAVARDHSELEVYRNRDETLDLFDEDPAISLKAQLREELTEHAMQMLRDQPSISTKDLARELLASSSSRGRYFGRFTEKQFTQFKREAELRLSAGR